MKKKAKITRKIGANKGNPRLWLEGKLLLEFGWNRGDHFFPSYAAGKLTYSKTPKLRGSPERAVAGTSCRPIIDTCGAFLGATCGFNTGETVELKVSRLKIVVTPLKPSKCA